MSEIDKAANAAESQVTESRRPRLLCLSPEMLREMAERGERTQTLGGSDQQSQTGVHMSDEPGNAGTEPPATVKPAG